MKLTKKQFFETLYKREFIGDLSSYYIMHFLPTGHEHLWREFKTANKQTAWKLFNKYYNGKENND